MKTVSGIVLTLGFLAITLPPASAKEAFHNFVTVKGDQLMDGGRPFRFISFNIPNLHLVEDNMVFADANAWRWPDRFEATDALESIRQQGGLVARTYVLSVVRTNDSPNVPRHVLGPGRFNEDGFHALDLVLQAAHQTGARVIIPFVDNWSWWGGITEYAAFCGKPKDAFWTDPQIIADFKETIRHLVNRTNTLTGIPYRNDKAILCWETGNELLSPPAWTREIAAYIKSLDSNHLVMDGYHTSELRAESLQMPEIDLVTTHHYPGGKKSFAQLIRENWQKAKGRKPYVVGEFGFVDTKEISATIDAIMETGTSGGLLWSLRYRNRDGGFYWHYEPAGGNKYKAYHWPGFPSGASYDEAGLMHLMQQKAFEIRGLPIPRLRIPAPPKLLPPAQANSLSWQGSAGATSYIVERAPRSRGPWTVAARDVDETAVQYRPLFVDTNVPKGDWHYRVRAQNGAGTSRPSNVVGPITVTHACLVDELEGFSRIEDKQGSLEIKTRDCRQAKEDAHRLAGQAGSIIVYHVRDPIKSLRLFAFFPAEVADFKFSISSDGKTYSEIPSSRTLAFSGSGDYDYWKPVCYQCDSTRSDSRFIKIEFSGPAQIGRIEIDY